MVPTVEPQFVTVPFLSQANACAPPAAMATTLVSPGGTFVPKVFVPQAMTVESLNNATWKFVPEAIAMTLVALAGMGALVWPHCTTVPFVFNARRWSPPAEIAIALVTFAGTLVWFRLLRPQPTTVPSLFNAKLLLSPATITVTFVTLGVAFAWPS